MKNQRWLAALSVITGALFVCPSAHSIDSLFPREHPSLAMTLGASGGTPTIVIDRWLDLNSKKKTKSEVERSLRDEIASYVFVTPEDRVKLEHTNSLLGFSGEGTFILTNGIEVAWKQTSSILRIRLPGRNPKSDWQDFAPRTWVLQLEKERKGPVDFP